LLFQRDDALLAPFGLTERTCRWLRTVDAKTLPEFAQAVVVEMTDASHETDRHLEAA